MMDVVSFPKDPYFQQYGARLALWIILDPELNGSQLSRFGNK